MKFDEYGNTVFEGEATNKYSYFYSAIGNLGFATMHILNKIYTSGIETFYASDFGINGGTMNALASIKFLGKTRWEECCGFVPTGNTKSTMVQVDENLYRKVEVKEWRINREVVKDYLDLYREGVKFALGE